MASILNLPDNFICKEDRRKLKSFGGHTVAHGRATRWRWCKQSDGDDAFEIYCGGADEELAILITRNRDKDAFYACDGAGNPVVSGTLDHVMAGLEAHFVCLHAEKTDSSAGP